MIYPYAESLMDPKNCASKRVSRACDRCRLKKTKCDGRRCCNRCLADDAICVFSKRKRSSDRPYSSEYVQLLEDQQMKLVEGVQELYRRLRRGEGWSGPSIAEDSQGYPLVQDVLDALSVLAPSEHKPAQKSKDITVITEVDDEEEDTINQQEQSVRLGSTSPPSTPPDYSQSSATSSPREEYPRDRSGTMFMHKSYPQMTTKPMTMAPPVCSSAQVLPCQPLIADNSEYWPTNPTFGGSVGQADFPDLIDPFHGGHNVHNEVNWYPGSYALM